MTRARNVAAIAAAAVALAATGSAQRNILLIVADDAGKADISAYGIGSDPAPTPEIDSIANNGTRFDNAWASPFCSPSRVAIQTGRYGHHTQVGHLINQNIPGPALSPHELTLPEMLELGSGGAYTTAAFGKWHMGNPYHGDSTAPNVAGYDTYKGVLVGEPDQYFNWTAVHDGVEVPQSGYLTAQTTNDVIDWMSTAPEPWFCYVAYHAPHTPLHAPPPSLHSQALPQAPPLGSGSEREFFKAMIEAMDHGIGLILDELGPKLDHTTVIFTSDNGTDGRWIQPEFASTQGKGTMFQGGTSIPLLVYDPGISHTGNSSTALVHLVDLYATIAQFAQIDLDATLGGIELDSVSFLPCAFNPTLPSIRRMVYGEHFAPNGPGPFQYYRKAVRDLRYKLMRIDQGELFFDLQNDPFETVDLLSRTLTPQEAFVYQQMSAKLDSTGLDVVPAGQAQVPQQVPVGLPDPSK